MYCVVLSVSFVMSSPTLSEVVSAVNASGSRVVSVEGACRRAAQTLHMHKTQSMTKPNNRGVGPREMTLE